MQSFSSYKGLLTYEIKGIIEDSFLTRRRSGVGVIGGVVVWVAGAAQPWGNVDVRQKDPGENRENSQSYRSDHSNWLYPNEKVKPGPVYK